MDSRFRNILIGGIIALGAMLRLWEYWAFSFTNDELSALARLGFDTLGELLQGGVRPDGHPAAAQVLLWKLTGWFGDSEAVVRLPFILAGTLSILYAYRIGRAWHSVSAGLLVAAALATWEFPLLYSRLARPYALGLLFSTMAAYHWVRIIRGSHGTQNLWMLCISLALCAYTHYFCGLTAAVMAFAGTFMLQGTALRHYLYALGGAVLLFLPHLSVTLHQIGIGGVGWIGVPGSDWPLEHLMHVMNGSYLVMAVTVGVGLLGWAVFRPHRRWTQLVLPLLLFTAPLGIGFLYSTQISPLLQHSVLLFSFPFLPILIFAGWDDRYRWLTVAMVAVMLGTGIYSTVWQNGFFRKEHFGVFGPLADRAVEWRARLGTDLLLVADVNHPSYLDRYLARTALPETRFHQYRVSEGDGLIRLKRLMDYRDFTHLAYAWSTIVQPLEVERAIREKFPEEVASELHFNSGIRLFRRGEAKREVLSVFEFGNTGEWQCNEALVQHDSLVGPRYPVNAAHPFGPMFQGGVQGLRGLTVYAEAEVEQTAEGILMVFEQWQGGERTVWEARPFSAQMADGDRSWAVFDFPFNEPRYATDTVKVYPWSASGNGLSLIHLELRPLPTDETD